MDRRNTNDALLYRVLMNRDGEFSVWPTGRQIPVGWMNVGFTARRSECLAYVASISPAKAFALKRRGHEITH